VVAGPLWLFVLPSVLLAAVLGLVPGVRELEVTGARSMLGADGELLLPRRARPAHHLQTAVWVLLHLGSGLLCAVLLATLVPAAVLHLVELAADRSLGSGLPLPGTGAGRFGAALLALLVAAAGTLLWWPLGAGLARLAPHLLGPTAGDRLELARQRADREAERTRIARELHDGIGHALTVVSVQAAAARTIQHRDPEAAAAALAAIEDTARSATGELDAVLALLREEGPDGRREDPPGERALDRDIAQLLASQRGAGMDLRARVELSVPPAPLLRRHLLRAATELLTNARRHGASGPVRMTLTSGEEGLVLEVRNLLRDAGPADGTVEHGAPVGGRGLLGLRERASLLGGTRTAGPHGGCWLARLDLPPLREETR
jgi:signal transduction histidine kinase